MKVKLFLLTSLLIVFAYLSSANEMSTISHASEPLDTGSIIYLPLVVGGNLGGNPGGNPLAHEEVFVPAGEFQRGCDQANNNGNTCQSEAQPRRPIYLDDYYFDKYEVTKAKYVAYLNSRGNNDCHYKCIDFGNQTHVTLQGGKYVVEAGYENYPMNAVTWYGADDYCRAGGRRLPTEAEWEKAYRGSGDSRAFPWGNDTPDCTRANYSTCGGSDFTEVGSFPLGVSPYGAMNMGGNVKEWVNDWFDDTASGYNYDYYEHALYNNPQGPDHGKTRGFRGSSWRENEINMLTSWRQRYHPENGHLKFGFRCARTP